MAETCVIVCPAQRCPLSNKANSYKTLFGDACSQTSQWLLFFSNDESSPKCLGAMNILIMIVTNEIWVLGRVLTIISIFPEKI